MRNVVFLQLEVFKFVSRFSSLLEKLSHSTFSRHGRTRITSGPLSRTLKPFIYLRLRDAEIISTQSLSEDIVSSVKLLKVVAQGVC